MKLNITLSPSLDYTWWGGGGEVHSQPNRLGDADTMWLTHNLYGEV